MFPNVSCPHGAAKPAHGEPASECATADNPLLGSDLSYVLLPVLGMVPLQSYATARLGLASSVALFAGFSKCHSDYTTPPINGVLYSLLTHSETVIVVLLEPNMAVGNAMHGIP